MKRSPGRPRLGNELGRKGLDEDVADRIRETILKGEVPAAAHLVELDLAARHEVSQGTVRAALKILQRQGLVEFRPRRGNFVTQITAADAFEIYTLRDALEALGARYAAERITDAGRRELNRALQALRVGVVSGNRRKVLELDFKFHRTIVELAGHRRLLEMYNLIEVQTRLFMSLTMTDRFHHDLTEVLALHKPIAEAIAKGDARRAAELASHHNERDGQRLIATMSSESGAESAARKTSSGR